ncbi:MAG: hypothetical protein ABL977_15375 [Candidatus Eisenbacteria bacterium]
MTVLSLLLSAALSCAPATRPFVTEVYYDAPGDDTGFEFVELWNLDAAPKSLAGLRIEAGDGAAPGRWTLKWTAQAGDSVAARSRFVVGGARVSPAPDRVATLDLQNGPDAVRLVWPDGTSEVVGWGPHDFDEYHCGTPAPDVAGGQSLARWPDGAATGSNAGDFRAAEPSPGAANQRTRDAALVRHRTALEPEQPDPAAPATMLLLLTNLGASAWSDGEARVAVSGELLVAPIEIAAPALAAGETTQVQVPLETLRAGRGAFVARVALPLDESALDDADTLVTRVGPGPLAVTEIQFHPAAAEGEWVEVKNATRASLALEEFRLGDRAGAAGRIDAGPPLAPDSLAVLAQDPTALLMTHRALDAARVRRVTPWAALNNSDDASGIADQVVVAEADGVPVERVTYSAGGLAAGVTLERAGQTWRPAPSAGGTPLAPPRPSEPTPGGFRAQPRRLHANGETVQFAWELPWESARVTLELYDLDGRRTRRLAGPVASGAHGERPVQLEALLPGVYLAVLRAESDTGSLTRVTALRVDGAQP